MTTEISILCVAILIATAIGGILCCRKIAHAYDGYANIKCLVILNYIVIQPLSGIVHLVRGGAGFRGYYDLLTGDARSVLISVAICVFGMVSLCVACVRTRAAGSRHTPSAPPMWLGANELLICCLAIGLIAVPAVNSLLILSSYVADVDQARVIVLEGGLARHNYIVNWLTWAISFAALIAVARKRPLRPTVTLIILSLAVVLIGVSLSWSGGRSIVVVMALPLVLVALPRLTRIKWPALVMAISGLVIYVTVISQIRSESLARGAGVSLSNWLDWEWGRFSLSGFAVEYVDQEGLLYGETFLSGLTSAVLAPLYLAGISIPDIGLRNTVEISGGMLLGNSDLVHIVPGLSAELYMNFGLIGVLIGYYVLGRGCVLIDRLINGERLLLERLALAFCGVVLVFRTIPSDSGTLYFFLFFTGFPLLLCAALAHWLRPRAARQRPPRRRSGLMNRTRVLRADRTA